MIAETTLAIGLAVATAAAAAAQGVSAMSSARKQASIDQDTYNNNVQIASQNATTAQNATNQVEVEAEQKAVQDMSARQMRADQALGTLRVQGSTAGTSQGSYNALMEQETYSEGTDMDTLQNQYGQTITSAEEDKSQDRVDYNNAVATAGTTLESAQARTSAASTSALLGTIGTGLSIGTSLNNQNTKSQASTDAYNQALKNNAAKRSSSGS